MVSVLISADSRFPISRPKIKKVVDSVLKEKKVSFDVEVSILVCGTRKSRSLAKKYLRDDTPHNVLSFPFQGDAHEFAFPTGKSGKGFPEAETLALGDIVICYPLAQEEANTDNVLVDTKISELIQHGMLHLLGEHHD